MSEGTVEVELSREPPGAALRGELDLLAYDEVTAELAPLFDATGDIVIDMSALSFIDSSGIRLFVRLQRAIGDRGRLVLRGATPHVASVLDVAGLRQLGIVLEPIDG